MPSAPTRSLLVIAGGSRATGRVLAEQARAAGHEVRVVDDPERSPDLCAALAGAGAVAIIPARGVVSLETKVRAVVDASHDALHIVLVTGFSIGHGMAHALNTPERLRDRRAAETLVRRSGLPYTIVRPTWLTSDPPGGYAITLTQDQCADGMIARADLAGVCLAAIAEPTARGKTFAAFAEPGDAPHAWAPLFSALQSEAA